jgi:Kef-type K+ transport system membrane component KefB
MDWLSAIAENPFYEFAIILFLAALFGGIGQFLRQPLIVMFIALGILIGPSVLDILKSYENIHLLADLGIAVLLFIVGLKLDLRIIKSVGKIASDDRNGAGFVYLFDRLFHRDRTRFFKPS